MKLTTFILIISLMQVSAASFGQRITLNQRNISIKQAFTEITNQTGYGVVIVDDNFNASRKVNAEFKNEELSSVMNKLLGEGFSFELGDKLIIIKTREKSFLDRVSDYFAAIDVHGKVVDGNGSPLGGATITIKATGKGVTAKADGNFSVTGVEEGAILVVSFMGYFPKELKATRDLGTIKLELSTSKLDEVQIQAYGQTTRRLSVANIATVKSDEIEKQNVTNPLLALQGRVPNLELTPSNGLPNTGIVVRIQGQNSINAGMDPLYIVDGVPYPSQTLFTDIPSPLGNSGNDYLIKGGQGNTLSFINPADIESIDILKDASATAIYGSRAANGAIIITTKKGKSGKMQVNFNVENGRSIIADNIAVLNSDQYVMMRREALRNDNIIPDENNAFDILNMNGWDNSRNTNWGKLLLSKKAQFTSANASVSGGGINSNYLFSGTYQKQGANTPGNYSDQKGSFHISVGTSSNDQKFKIQFIGNYVYDRNLLPAIGSLANSAVGLSPTAPTIYNGDGTLNWGLNSAGFSTWGNPYAALKNPYRNITNNLIANLDLSYEVLKNLQLQLHSGFNSFTSKQFSATYLSSLPPEADPVFSRTSFFANNSQQTWSLEPKISYSSTVGPGQVNLLLGATLNQNYNDGTSLIGYGYASDNLQGNITNAPFPPLIGDVNSQYKYAAVFSRLNYNILNRYLIEFSGRRDGSSRFGPENRYHTFAAFGLGWIFSEENFLKNRNSFLSFGKLRFSYGTTGNDQINDYSYLDLLSSLNANLPYQQIVALTPTKLFNPVLQWEETTKSNYGIDLGFFRDRITMHIDHYRNYSGNTLQNLALATTTGIGVVQYNFDAKIRNSGWEININSTNLSTKKFRWTTNIVFSTQRNKLLSLPTSLAGTNLYEIGQDLNYFRSQYFDFEGVDSETGRNLYRSGNGGLTFTPDFGNDRTYVNLNPKWTGGIGNSLSYKGLQLDFFFSVVQKKSLGYFGDINNAGTFNLNVPDVAINRWQNPGDVTFLRKFTTAIESSLYFPQSTGNIIDGSYIKLRNLSLSWTLPESLLKAIKMQHLTVYTQAQNVFWLSKYQGYDPETGTNTPPTRVFTIGLKATL